MYVNPYVSATFALVTAWSVGIATSVAVADTEVGLIRDHPLFGRRLSARVVPLLAAIGLVTPFFVNSREDPTPPHWVLKAVPVMLPFAVISWFWSRAWVGRTPALRRRRLGVIAVVAGLAGLVACSFLAVEDLEPAWRLAIPTAILAATAALLGSMTNFSLLALTQGLPSEVPSGRARGLAEVTAAGLIITSIAGLDTGWSWLSSDNPWPHGALPLAITWGVASLLVPGCLLLARLRFRRLPDAVIMTLALASVVVGQWAALLMVFRFPGLVPPQP